MNPIISVIIPVYNSEKYLEDCVNSVLNQSFRNIEIILINDCSTDESGNICDCLGRKFNNIHVYHNRINKGPSYSRNYGIDKAKGDYITFVDSDDIIHTDYLDIMLSLSRKFDADLTSCEFVFCLEGKSPVFLDKEYKTGVYSGKESLVLMLQGKLHGSSSCGLLISKKLAKNNLFPVGKYHEDDITTFRYFIQSEKVSYTKKPLYVYFQHDGSIMHRRFSEIDIDELDAGDFVFNECEIMGSEFKEAALIKKTYNYYDVLHKNPELANSNQPVYIRIMNFFRDNILSILLNNNIGIKIKLFSLYSLIKNARNN